MTRADAIIQVSEKISKSNDYVEHAFDFLDALRLSGKCNMFSATTYLVSEYDKYLTLQHTKVVLKYWMDSFGK